MQDLMVLLFNKTVSLHQLPCQTMRTRCQTISL